MPSRPRLRVCVFFWTAVAVALLDIHVLGAQPAPEDHSAYFGGWTLNRELSSQPPSLEPSRGDHGRLGGGRGGGDFGGPGGRGGVGRPPFDPEQMKRTTGLMQELMAPLAHLVITSAEGGAIRFTEADGLSRKFVPNDTKEKHQFVNGTIETKTKWEDGELRQEFLLAEGMRLVRTYAVTPEPKQLVVATTMDGGPGGRRDPIRFVYEADADR